MWLGGNIRPLDPYHLTSYYTALYHTVLYCTMAGVVLGFITYGACRVLGIIIGCGIWP